MTIGQYKCASLRMWFVIPCYHKIFIFAVLERRLIYDSETECRCVYLVIMNRWNHVLISLLSSAMAGNGWNWKIQDGCHQDAKMYSCRLFFWLNQEKTWMKCTFATFILRGMTYRHKVLLDWVWRKFFSETAWILYLKWLKTKSL